MTDLNRRAWMRRGMAAAAATVLAARPAVAQGYPQRPVRLIVPYSAGGGTDVFSRLLAASK